MPEATEQDRLIILKQNADSFEETTYQKPLTEEEKTLRREILTENSIKLFDLEEEKKEATLEFKAKIDPLKKDNNKLLNEIRTGQVPTTGTLYHFANHDENMMDVYDDKGYLVEARRLRPHERQGNLLRMIK
jgi:hypothetical protein